MSSLRSRLGRVLASSRLAALLIGAQVAFLLLAYSIPQRGIFPEEQVTSFFGDIPSPVASLFRFLGFDHVFTSPLFYATAVLLGLNLVACTWGRIARRVRRRAPRAEAVAPEGTRGIAVADRRAFEVAAASLGAQTEESEDGVRHYYLRRGDAGFIGSVVMHAALVLVLVGGVLTGLTTFRGEMVLTEGQTSADVPEGYLSVSQVPVLGTPFTGFEVTLERMEFTYEQGAVVDAVASMRITDGSGSREGRARVNYPLKAYGKSFLLQDAGHSVWITVEDASGATLVDSFVNLADLDALGYRDSLVVGNDELLLVSRPDAAEPLDAPVSDSLLLSAPIVGVALGPDASADAYTWMTPGSAPLRLGSYTVTVHEVRIWNRFMVRADGGRYVMYAAFLLVIVGALTRFADPDRWLRFTVAADGVGATVLIWGAERYRSGVLPREGRRLLRVAGPDAVHALEEEASDDS